MIRESLFGVIWATGSGVVLVPAFSILESTGLLSSDAGFVLLLTTYIISVLTGAIIAIPIADRLQITDRSLYASLEDNHE